MPLSRPSFAFKITLLFFFVISIRSQADEVIDASTLTGKVMCGYQGWFGTPGDGSKFNRWIHWGRDGAMKPGSATVDLWPDVSELDPDELFPTDFQFANGKVANVFSSYNSKTVLRHFKWMHDYGIDGVFLQRFATGLSSADVLDHGNKVLANVRSGANKSGRVFGMMYDLSGLKDDQVDRVITDWKQLIDESKLTNDPRYIHHRGKPVVALWGYGFAGKRDPLLGSGGFKLIKFFKDDPKYGGNCIFLGVPSYWQARNRDAVNDPKLIDLIAMADVISPWTVGRYSTPEQATEHGEKFWKPDLQWCSVRGKDYMPVVFPGFSWHNLQKGNSPVNQIPRLGGKFLWSQYVAAKAAGSTMVYQAMFDEVDEGTAIFKCANEVPDGKSQSEFLGYEGLPSDFYLKLVGDGSRLMRGEIKASAH